jgi:hypothetical protein
MTAGTGPCETFSPILLDNGHESSPPLTDCRCAGVLRLQRVCPGGLQRDSNIDITTMGLHSYVILHGKGCTTDH